MPLITSPINKALPLRGVVPAAFPALQGTTLHVRDERVNLQVPQATPVTVSLRVLRSNITGLLHFEYRLALPESDYDDSIKLSISFPTAEAKITFADFRIDGPGVIPPNYFESAAIDPPTFRFDYGLSVQRSSRTCFLATTAQEFRETGGTLKLITGRTSISLDVPAPLGSAMGKMMPPAQMKQDAPEEIPTIDVSISEKNRDGSGEYL